MSTSGLKEYSGTPKIQGLILQPYILDFIISPLQLYYSSECNSGLPYLKMGKVREKKRKNNMDTTVHSMGDVILNMLM